MLLLHISDIHFRAPECAQDNDPNRVYRTRMVQDAKARAGALGPVSAILVGGHIAFCGAPTEYAAAFTWLAELARECSCHLERIYVVPGNHDVDRSLITRSRQVRNIHKAIKGAEPGARQRELQAQLLEEATGRALFQPLSAYNDFAAKFNCQVYPERIAWKQDLALNGGLTLRLHGLTSTLLSGAVNDRSQDDQLGGLYLSPWQTGLLDPKTDLVNLVMSHHPPDWFMDKDEVEDAINGRAAIHLFGHRHRQRLTRDNQFIRFDAGAVNPDPNELGWHPCYNLIELKVIGTGADRELRIAVHQLEWQTNPERYRARQDVHGHEVFHHVIRCPGDEAPSILALAGNAITIAPPAPDPLTSDVDAAMGEQSIHNLVMRWWALPMAARREIALRLGLISQEEVSLPEPERYGRALLRAKERNQLQGLSEEIDKWQNN